MQKENWLPSGYEVPESSGSRYFKFKKEANKFRVLSAPVLGYEFWNLEGKPVRLKDVPEVTPDNMREGDKIKHFWAFAVWNYDAKSVQILEITQASIQRQIEDLVTNDDWGTPQDYDITVNATGDGLKREYTVQPSPHKEVPEDARKAYKSTPVDLEAFFSGGDPFKNNKEDITMEQA